MGEDDKLALPTIEELRTLSNAALIDRINGIILGIENEASPIHNRRGGTQIAIVRVEYLTQELVRRDQAKQNSLLTGLTVAIGIMTLVIMLVTLWPEVRPHP